MNPHRILILAPHTDDAELGCGGNIARLTEQGAEVYVAAFSTAEASVPKHAPPDTLEQEFYASMSILGVPRDRLFVFHYPVRWFSSLRQEILEELVSLRNIVRPEMLFLPSSQDMHQDHQVIHQEGLRAFKETTVFGYELPWNQLALSAQAPLFPWNRALSSENGRRFPPITPRSSCGAPTLPGSSSRGWPGCAARRSNVSGQKRTKC